MKLALLQGSLGVAASTVGLWTHSAALGVTRAPVYRCAGCFGAWNFGRRAAARGTSSCRPSSVTRKHAAANDVCRQGFLRVLRSEMKA